MRAVVLSALAVAALALVLVAIDPAFFVKDDFQLEFLPASHEVAQAWADGELPLLTRASWMCSALAAEYQFGVFSVFRMLLEGLAWLLPLSLLARGTLLFVVHVAIAGAGGYLLARSYGVRPASALMVALIAGLNGWMLWWGTTWYAITASFAWLPWYWLGLRGIAAGRRWSWAGTAAALYLLITGGAPYVVAMAALIALMNVLAQCRAWLQPASPGGGRAEATPYIALRMVAASALGLALAAPAVLMLLEYFPATARLNASTRFEDLWVVPVRALFAFVVPAFTTEWNVFRGALPHVGVELLGAFVPLAALIGKRRRGLPAPELILALLLLVLMLLPSAGPFRWSFRWLPLFHLVLAILGAIALEEAKRAWIVGLVLLGITVAFQPGVWIHAAVLAALCLAWSRFQTAMPAILTAAAIVLTFAAFHDREEVSRWTIRTGTQLDPSRRYLAMYGVDSMQHAALLPGNLPMLAGRKFVNGYSPMGLAALNDVFQFDVHGPIRPDRAEQLLRYESGRNQLLHHLGVDGLLVPVPLVQRNAALLSRNGWTPAARIADCFVLHRERLSDPLFLAALAVKTPGEQQAYEAVFQRRTPQLPVVLLADGGRERYGPRQLANVVEARNETTFVVRGKGSKALIVFRRPWLPGWRASIGETPLPVLRANLLMPAVEIPAGAEGEVRLVYRPRSLRIGAAIAGLALLAMAAVAIRIRGAR
ncbi:MAG TPA: hypothetical protein VF432_22185 [Thermoanaerobaculia bacterium]